MLVMHREADGTVMGGDAWNHGAVVATVCEERPGRSDGEERFAGVAWGGVLSRGDGEERLARSQWWRWRLAGRSDGAAMVVGRIGGDWRLVGHSDGEERLAGSQ